MKNVSVESELMNKMPKIVNVEKKYLLVDLQKSLLLKAHRDLICKIHKKFTFC